MRISDWSSDVCSSDLLAFERQLADQFYADLARLRRNQFQLAHLAVTLVDESIGPVRPAAAIQAQPIGVVEPGRLQPVGDVGQPPRSGLERIGRDAFEIGKALCWERGGQ